MIEYTIWVFAVVRQHGSDQSVEQNEFGALLRSRQTHTYNTER